MICRLAVVRLDGQDRTLEGLEHEPRLIVAGFALLFVTSMGLPSSLSAHASHLKHQIG